MTRCTVARCRCRCWSGARVRAGDCWCCLVPRAGLRRPAQRRADRRRRGWPPSTTRFSTRASIRLNALLKQTCPPAPEGACQALRVVSLWWQIQINPESRALDRRFPELAAVDHRRQRGVDPARAAARRSVVLSRGRLCAARAVAGPSRRADRRRARRQAGSKTRSSAPSSSTRR